MCIKLLVDMFFAIAFVVYGLHSFLSPELSLFFTFLGDHHGNESNSLHNLNLINLNRELFTQSQVLESNELHIVLSLCVLVPLHQIFLVLLINKSANFFLFVVLHLNYKHYFICSLLE